MKSMLFLCLTLIITSCYYDNEEELYPVIDNNCDTTNITYAGTVKKMIDESCIGCHSSGTVVLTNYTQISSQATAILGSIKHEGGYKAMPQGAAKLSDCKINQFDIWITQGKPNN
jgi:hypothetical protein